MENIWVTKAEYIKDYELKLNFNDGSTGIVNLKDSLNKPIFEPLRDINYFKQFKLNSWTLEWENGADFAPEYLYDQTKKTRGTNMAYKP